MKQSLALIVFIFLTILVSCVHAQETDYDLVWSYETDGWVRSVAVSADGKYVAAGSQDTYVYFFDKDGNRLWRHKTGSFINSVSTSSDGSYIGTASDDTNVYFFDRNGTILWVYDLGTKGVELVSVSSDGTYVSATSDNKVYFFDRKGGVLWSYKIGGDINGLSVSFNGSYVAVGSGDTNVYFFDRDGELLWTYDLGNIGISSVSVSSNGSYVVATSRHDDVHQINDKGVLRWNSQIDGEAVYVSIHANGSSIAVQSDDNVLYFFSKEGDLLESRRINSSIRRVSISQDGSYISASYGRPDPNVYLFAEKVSEAVAENATIVNLTTIKSSQKTKIVILANSIDYDMATDFFEFLENQGIEIVHASASDFTAQYKNEKFIVILGGPDAYERVGGVVREALTEDEQNAIRKSGARKMYVKTDVWAIGQKVMVIAGSDREQTKVAHQENKEQIASEFES